MLPLGSRSPRWTRNVLCLVFRLSYRAWAAAEFDGTLVSVLQSRPADCEVLVVHTEPYDDPYELRGEVRFIQAASESLVELLNTALAESAGEVLHIVGCGLEATEHWTAAAVAHFEDPDVAAVSPLVLDKKDRKVVAAGIRWSLGGARRVISDQRVATPGSGRLRASIHGPTLTAAFYRREVLAALGGFDATLEASLADVDAALAIQALGKLHICEPASELLLASDQETALTDGFRGGRGAERLFWQYAVERGLASALLLHPLAIGGDAAARVANSSLISSLAGRAAAWLDWTAARRHQDRLSSAAEQLAELAKLRTKLRSTVRERRPSVTADITHHRRAA